MRTLVLLIGPTLLAGCGGRAEPTRRDPNAIEFNVGGWHLACEVTGRGGEDSDSGFSAQFIDRLAEQKGRHAAEREFAGYRWAIEATVKNHGGPVPPGEYTMFGSVKAMSIPDRRMRLTDCVFVPRK